MTIADPAYTYNANNEVYIHRSLVTGHFGSASILRVQLLFHRLDCIQNVAGRHDDNTAAGTRQFGIDGINHNDNRGQQGPTIYAFGDDEGSGNTNSSGCSHSESAGNDER